MCCIREVKKSRRQAAHHSTGVIQVTCCMYTKKPKMETLQEYGWVTPRYTTFYVPRSTVHVLYYVAQ